MKKALSLLSLAALTIGLLGSCSKINERIDGVEKRVESIENEKIASIENQIAAINSSIADLGRIRSDISSLKQSAVNHGQDISELQEADEILKNRIDNLEDYLDGDLKKYAEKDWAIATFATLEKLDSTKMDLSALEGKVNKLGETFDGKLSDLKTELTNSINTAVSNLETRISTLEARVSALEQMIQSVSITSAYSDGSVEAVDSILTLKCIVNPAEALIGMKSLKDSLVLYADSVKVKTKATTDAYMTIEVSEASVLDAAQGAITLTADISEYLPKGENKALTVAVNIKNGISHFTTEFVPVYVAPKTFKAVYDTNGGANTLTFFYVANDHSGEGITVYDNLPTAATKAADWGYNDKRGEIKSVVIDASVADYKGLTSTAFMFQGMTKATGISGAEYLDVSNVTDMSWMFQNFGGGANGSPTTLNSVPDVSGWDTGKVTNMAGMFWGYGNFSSELDKVPDVSGWNTGEVTNMSNMFQKYGNESQNFNAVPDVSNWDTGNVTDMANIFNEYGDKSTKLDTIPNVSNWKTDNVTNMQQMFYNYGNASTNISCVLDLSGWDLSKITGTNGVSVFKFNPKTFDVTIPAKTGEKSNEGGKWYYGDGTNSIAPPAGKTFTPLLPAGALKGVFSVSATKKVHFSQGNLYVKKDDSGNWNWNFYDKQYACNSLNSNYTWQTTTNRPISKDDNESDLFSWGYGDWSKGLYSPSFYVKGYDNPDNDCEQFSKTEDWGYAFGGESSVWRTLNVFEWEYLFGKSTERNGKYQCGVTVCGHPNCVVLLPDNWKWEGAVGTEWQKNTAGVFEYSEKTTVKWSTMEEAGAVCLPSAGYSTGASVRGVELYCAYWTSSGTSELALWGEPSGEDFDLAHYLWIAKGKVYFYDGSERMQGNSVRLVTEVK